jgi:hypothetical protein
VNGLSVAVAGVSVLYIAAEPLEWTLAKEVCELGV